MRTTAARSPASANGWVKSTMIVPSAVFNPGDVVDKTFSITTNGTYTYFCTNTACSPGHNSMVGEFIVGVDDGGGGPHYKH